MNFHERVEAVKKAKAMTVSEVAGIIGVSTSMLSMVKSGYRKPSIKTMRRLMEAERACGIVPPEDHLLPAKKMKQLEYGIPGDPEVLREGARVVREQVDLIKAIRAGIRGEVRAAVREELGDIRKLLISLLAAERSRGTSGSGAEIKDGQKVG